MTKRITIILAGSLMALAASLTDAHKLKLSRIRAKDAMIQAQMLKLAMERMELQREWEAAVQALPGYKPGCQVDMNEELTCPKEEQKK